MHEKLEVHLLPESCIVQTENALHQQYISSPEKDPRLLPLARLVVVVGDCHTFPSEQPLHNVISKTPVNGIRMVEVIVADLLKLLISTASTRNLDLRKLLVEAVHRQQGALSAKSIMQHREVKEG